MKVQSREEHERRKKMLTKKRIYELAWHEALAIWDHEEQLNKVINDEYSHRRVNKAWEVVKELEELIRQEEQ